MTRIKDLYPKIGAGWKASKDCEMSMEYGEGGGRWKMEFPEELGERQLYHACIAIRDAKEVNLYRRFFDDSQWGYVASFASVEEAEWMRKTASDAPIKSMSREEEIADLICGIANLGRGREGDKPQPYDPESMEDCGVHCGTPWRKEDAHEA